MAFNYTNFLETAVQANNADFLFYDRAGAVGPVAARNTAGEWCEETTGVTTSTGTGPAANPAGRSGYIYSEASTPAASTVWRFQRDTTFDTTATGLTLNLIYNVNVDVGSEFYVEYATIASPNETTDWTILATIPGTLIDSWIQGSWDIGAVAVSTTTRVRIRLNALNAFTNDFAFSTWNEVGADLASRDQAAFRFYADGTESGSTALEAQNTVITIATATVFQARVGAQATGDPAAESATLQYKETGDAASEWRDVP